MSAERPLPPLLMRGDCVAKMRTLPDASIDAVVTDPPYGLDFMGKDWDRFTPLAFEQWVTSWAAEALRVLKPGGHLLAFGGSRTWHRLAAGIEDAGFEVRDSIAWLSNATFPGSHNLKGDGLGWGTRLKPTMEPLTVSRKPFRGTLQANFDTYGTGALNIDAARIPTDDDLGGAGGSRQYGNDVFGKGLGVSSGRSAELGARWPANAVVDEAVADELGGASRFFYVAKAPKSERPVTVDPETGQRVAHPTVKPLALMRWLVRLVTPPGGVVLDPFAGSGTTLEAAHLEGFEAIGVELTPDYWPLIESRIARAVEARAKGADNG